MKIDHEYLKKLLEAMQATLGTDTNMKEIEAHGFSLEDPKLLFHMEILYDSHLVIRCDGKEGVGFIRASGGDGIWSVVPLRLTASGHDFIEAISNDTVWNKLKKNFKEASIARLLHVSRQLLDSVLRGQVKGLLP